MKKVLEILGARPQFIKAAQVSKANKGAFQEVVVHTGQHYDSMLSDIFFKELSMPEPTYNLAIGSGSHGHQTGMMVIEIEKVLLAEKPDLVVLYGDTNSTLSGAIAASKLKMPIAHVEAGLRNFDKTIPEEINRLVTDHLSSLLFAPTQTAIDNLKAEGLTVGVSFTGDVMYDYVLSLRDIAAKHSTALTNCKVSKGNYILATIHRPENTDHPDRLLEIFKAFNHCGEQVIVPLHPRTVKMLDKLNFSFHSNVTITEPKGPMDFIQLLVNAKKFVTDSGGAQKEAYLLDIPCITIYNSTSWVETVRDGWNKLSDANEAVIIDHIRNFTPTGTKGNYFGDGNASGKIVELISSFL